MRKTGSYSNCEKSGKKCLTEKQQVGTVKSVPDNVRHNSKQTKGGTVDNDAVKPPLSGFCVSAAQLGDNSTRRELRRNTTLPHSSNTSGVSFWTLRDSRRSFDCQHSKQTKEANAMKHNNQGTTTPVVGSQGYTAATTCLLPTSLLLDTLIQAKAERAQRGKANAYGVLLDHFHKAILPAFYAECGGNLSEIARLTGLHRESVKKYVTLAEIDTQAAINGGAA
jgi:hypothetical protein